MRERAPKQQQTSQNYGRVHLKSNRWGDIALCWKAQWPVVGSCIPGSIPTEPWIHLPALCLACGDAVMLPFRSRPGLPSSFGARWLCFSASLPLCLERRRRECNSPRHHRHCRMLCLWIAAIALTCAGQSPTDTTSTGFHMPLNTTVRLEARESSAPLALQGCAPVNRWPVTATRCGPLADARRRLHFAILPVSIRAVSRPTGNLAHSASPELGCEEAAYSLFRPTPILKRYGRVPITPMWPGSLTDDQIQFVGETPAFALPDNTKMQQRGNGTPREPDPGPISPTDPTPRLSVLSCSFISTATQ